MFMDQPKKIKPILSDIVMIEMSKGITISIIIKLCVRKHNSTYNIEDEDILKCYTKEFKKKLLRHPA